MIALTIVATWLALTGAGFAWLAALRRAGARERAEACAMSSPELRDSTLADVRALADVGLPFPGALMR